MNFRHYVIFDENGQIMRWVKTKDEAEKFIKIYEGWSYHMVKPKKEKLDLPDAPF